MPLQLPELPSFDLDAYLARIGYAGPRAPTLALLGEIQRRHVETIPFENLASLSGESVALDLAALQHKLVGSRRGGYCYEQNVLFAAALQRLGYAVTGLAARVRWDPSRALGSNPRSHMLLELDLPEGKYIADVGFGRASLPGPLALVARAEQQTPIESYRLMPHEEGYQLEMQWREAWRTVYSFDLQPQQYVDYVMANWFVSTYPASQFVHTLMVARIAGTQRLTLNDATLRSHALDGRSELRELASADELRAILARLFGIEVPDTPRMATTLERIVQRSASKERKSTAP